MVMQCRSCLAQADEYVDMSSVMAEHDCSYLEGFCGLTMLPDDSHLPLTMCKECCRRFEDAFEFVQTARHADEVLRANVNAILDGDNEDEEKEEEEEEEEGCLVEELDEPIDMEGSQEEIVEIETIEGDILESSIDDQAQYREEKALVEQFLIEESIMDDSENVKMKVEEVDPGAFYSEDELDDEYLVEFNESDSQTSLSERGSKWKCSVCKRVLRGDVSYVGHMNMHKGLRPYNCVKCQCAFRCKYALERHHFKRHSATKELVEGACELCQEVFSSPHQLDEHHNETHKKAITNCSKCSKPFNDILDLEVHHVLMHSSNAVMGCNICSIGPLEPDFLIDHYRREHPEAYEKNLPSNAGETEAGCEDRQWQCSVCGRTLLSEEVLRRHQATHRSDRPHECQTCGKRFSTPTYLRNHTLTMHAEEYENGGGSDGDEFVQCKICRKQLLKKNFERHMALHQRKETGEGQPKFLCAYCSRECKSQKTLNQHERMHQGETADVVYQCADCDRHYRTRNLLDMHRKQAHKERDNICPICGNAFKLKNQLMNHMKLHLEKNIQCTLCDKKYARKFDLDVHMRSHTGETPYECHLCGKRFAIKVRLTYHLQKHYGVKHHCKECGAEFNSKQKLKAHSFKHTGMPYRCEKCDDHGFANRDVFKRHLLRVHSTTMTDDALVEMFQRNTGKTIRIQPVVMHDNDDDDDGKGSLGVEGMEEILDEEAASAIDV